VTTIIDFLKNKTGGRSIVAGLIVTGNILKGENAAEIVNSLANDPVQHKNENFSNIVQFTNLISQSLRTERENEVWVNKKEFNGIVF